MKSTPSKPLLSILSLAALASGACASEPEPELGTSEQGLIAPPAGVVIGPKPLPVPITLADGGVRGVLQCHGLALADARLQVGGVFVNTDAVGGFKANIPGSGSVSILAGYDTPISSDGITSQLRVVDELNNGRSETVSRTGRTAISKGVTWYELGTINLTSLDCELFRIGRLALLDYHATRRATPPTGMLQIKRQSDVYTIGPYTFYTMINIQTNWLSVTTPASRESTIFHEFGHALRHAADGPEDHWHWDNFRWAYARAHDGSELFNKQYAFNEGWANFWRMSRGGVIPSVAGADATERHNMHFNEDMIARQLLRDAALPSSSRRIMMEVLEANPGTIHSLHDFETRLYARLGRPAPAAPPSCPLGWADDGLTCRTGGEVVAKSSYGRGVGTPQDQCGAGNVNDAGLCYPACAENYDNFGALCIQDCAPGYADHGLTCFNDIFNWYWKNSYGRGVGWVPSGCSGGKELNDGLCYDPCRTGFSGGGPVCYSQCLPGWVDDGALCRNPLSIITKE
jgi:hypothetical protein